MLIKQTPPFKKVYKKLHLNQLVPVNAAIKEVIANPDIGTQKTGDLTNVRVYKFKIAEKLMLLGYEVSQDKQELIFTALGPHENFYRDLKR